MNKENKITKDNNLTQRDLEMLERIYYKGCDDVAISIARSFERMEERVDSMESRIYSRLGELENVSEVKEDSKLTK